jgi:hypothetical protein
MRPSWIIQVGLKSSEKSSQDTGSAKAEPYIRVMQLHALGCCIHQKLGEVWEESPIHFEDA